MSTTLRGERKGTRRSSLSNSGAKLVYEETRVYIVESNVYDEEPLTVQTTIGLPSVFIDSIPGTFGYCLCTSKNSTQTRENGKIWDVECTFTTNIEGQETGEPEAETGPNPADPTTWVPIYKGSFDHVPKVLYKDLDDKPYLNYAGDRFPDPITYRNPVPVYEFWQIEDPSVTDVEIGERSDSINEIEFRGWEAKKLKLMVLGFERGFWYGVESVKIDYRLAYNRSGWENQPIQAGYSYRKNPGAKPEGTDRLVWLKPDGTERTGETEPLYGSFRVCGLLDFNDFLR